MRPPLISSTSTILSSLYADRLHGRRPPVDHRPIGLQRNNVRGAHEAEREECELPRPTHHRRHRSRPRATSFSCEQRTSQDTHRQPLNFCQLQKVHVIPCARSRRTQSPLRTESSPGPRLGSTIFSDSGCCSQTPRQGRRMQRLRSTEGRAYTPPKPT